MDTSLDALPDLSDAQVILYTEWPGRSPDLVEDQIAYPLTTALLTAPGVQSLRGQNYMGLSFVYVIFEDGTDIYWALLARLAPIFWSAGAGADVMKRIAAPMMGGIASALVMVLVVFPAIYALWKGHDLETRTKMTAT